MKSSALTVRLEQELAERLERAARRAGQSRSEFVREAIRRRLSIAQFKDLRRRIMPFAEAGGYLTDGDILRDGPGAT